MMIHMGMNMTDFLLIFVAGFASVFALGFQSRVVNAGNYKLAAMMSFLIAMSQAFLWGIFAKAQSSLLASAIYGLSGMAAITSAMWFHQTFFAKKTESK
jgi:hypothetical protein